MKDLKAIFFPERMLSDRMFLNFLQARHFQVKTEEVSGQGILFI